jgi:hypothetical protein
MRSFFAAGSVFLSGVAGAAGVLGCVGVAGFSFSGGRAFATVTKRPPTNPKPSSAFVKFIA